MTYSSSAAGCDVHNGTATPPACHAAHCELECGSATSRQTTGCKVGQPRALCAERSAEERRLDTSALGERTRSDDVFVLAVREERHTCLRHITDAIGEIFREAGRLSKQLLVCK